MWISVSIDQILSYVLEINKATQYDHAPSNGGATAVEVAISNGKGLQQMI
jgi:hypothetical protein